MNPRATGVLLIVAVLLGAFVYFYEIRGEESRKQADLEASRVFSDIEPEDIPSISLTTSDGVDARVERRDGRWRVVEPVDFPGDEVALDGISSTLAQLVSESVIAEPQPPQVYGLGDEALAIHFRVGETERTLRIGNKTPVGANSYVATSDSEKVFTVSTWRVNSLRKSLDDLRDRRPLHFDRAQINRVRASWPGGGVEIEKRDEGWWIVDPIEDRADDSTLETLLSDLSFLRATGFVDEPGSDRDVGLDKPEFSVELDGATDDTDSEALQLRLALGGILDGRVRLARAMESALYRIPEERLSDFPRRLVAYRFKDLSSFVASEAQAFELSFEDPAGERLQIEGKRHDGGWETSPQSMMAGKASDLVAELARLKGVDIVADAMGETELAGLGLAPPRVRIRVWGAPEEEGGEGGVLLAEVHLGRVDPDRGIVARTPLRSVVYRIAHDLAERLPVSAEAFRNRFASRESEEDSPEADTSADQTSDPLLDDEELP